MNRYTRTFVTVAVVIIAIVGCVSPLATSLVRRFFTIAVLPSSDPDGVHRIEPNGEGTIEVEVRMGANVTSDMMVVSLSGVPSGVLDLTAIAITSFEADETKVLSFSLLAFDDVVPGSYQVTVTASGEINPGEIDSTESTSFTLIVVGPDGSDPEPDPSDGDGDGGGGTAADGSSADECAAFVAHYNSLSCVTEPLTVETSCSESVDLDCSGGEAFYECRIENTSCVDGELVEGTECGTLLDCS